MKTIRIGNGAGFWGDSPDAPRRLAERGDLDYLTLEYLAELTLSILAYQRSKNPAAGFVGDLPGTVHGLLPQLTAPRPLRLITNGGGMNAAGCAAAVARELMQAGVGSILIAAVTGDDLLERIANLQAAGESWQHFETGAELGDRASRITSANAYLGCAGIVSALNQGAQIIVTGRVADASLTVGPAVYEFGWAADDWPHLAAATAAGHLIECGAQVTGGMYSDWDPSIDLGNLGYPIAELRADGTTFITKPQGTGGVVSVGTVSEQLVYEIGDPRRYVTPDVVADFSRVTLHEISEDRVEVRGATGAAAPARLKVSMSYHEGFSCCGSIVVTGPRAADAAGAAAAALQARVRSAGYGLEEFYVERLGAGETAPGMSVWSSDAREIVLRICARATDRAALERFARELAPLVTSGPPGVTGYTGARARPHPVLAFWPTTVSRDAVEPKVDVRSVQEWLT